MKVIELLSMVSEYQRVCIYPADGLDWNDENPYNLQGDKVRELKWVFVERVGRRTVEKIASDINESEDQYNKSILKICYR